MAKRKDDQKKVTGDRFIKTKWKVNRHHSSFQGA
jgi:hypothetical protein